MCGIVGFLNLKNQKFSFDPLSVIKEMINQVKSRGPDFQDFWHDQNNKVFLGHTRLAIIDLNKRSNQPIHSKDKKWTIIFNGEIYNFEELKSLFNDKEELHGDTGVLIALIEKFGFEIAIKKIHGMFAIAAWDNSKGKLFLTRDRIGEKPLYYSIDNELLSFASNINSLKMIPNKNFKICKEATNFYFKLNYIPKKKSIYENIFKILPGNYLEFDTKVKSHKIKNYWNFNDSLNFTENDDILSLTDNVLNNSVERQLVSDVEVGTFLSGGVDSSLITAISKNFLGDKLKTFTLGNQDPNFDESQRAKDVSNFLGFENLNYIPIKNDVLNTIYDLPKIYGEPFGDSSQIPTILISKFAKNYVKVVLSGDGGDELFGGYNRYRYFQSIYPKLKLVPNYFLKKFGFMLKHMNPNLIDRVVMRINQILPSSQKKYNYGYSINKFGRLLECNNYKDSFFNLICNQIDNRDIFIDQNISELEPDIEINNIQDVIKHDLLNYLPDDILCKVDRASMAYGLEARAPFVDKEVVEFAQKIPIDLKLKHGKQKYILKELLKKHLPEKIFEGQKRGFSVPISSWLKNELKELLMDYSKKNIILDQNIFNFKTINMIIEDHLKEKRSNEKFLWSYLVFQIWYFQNK